jgi:hypothetical protein
VQRRSFGTLRELVLHHAAGRGWRTQRHVAVACGLEESTLSRFLNGEQDLGARRTHAFFKEVGIPVEMYDQAYALLGREQESARAGRLARLRRAPNVTMMRRDRAWTLDDVRPPAPRASLAGMPRFPSDSAGLRGDWRNLRATAWPSDSSPSDDLFTAAIIALFQDEQYTSAEIAAFFGG